MAFIGRKFPDITVDAMDEMGDKLRINVLEEAVKNNKKVCLFWYPKDFSFLCPTELHAFQKALPEFEKRNTIVIGASCDTPEVHFGWLSTAKEDGGIKGITYPILADSNRNLSNILDILDITDARLNEEYGTEELTGSYVTYRATYLLDEQGNVFHESINHMPLGRNVGEILRQIDSFTHLQTHGELCPPNWQDGDAGYKGKDGMIEYLKSN